MKSRGKKTAATRKSRVKIFIDGTDIESKEIEEIEEFNEPDYEIERVGMDDFISEVSEYVLTRVFTSGFNMQQNSSFSVRGRQALDLFITTNRTSQQFRFVIRVENDQIITIYLGKIITGFRASLHRWLTETEPENFYRFDIRIPISWNLNDVKTQLNTHIRNMRNQFRL